MSASTSGYRLLFTGHECQTAGHANLAGLKNGALLTAAEAAGFEVLITTDQAIPYQQNLTTRQLSIGSHALPRIASLIRRCSCRRGPRRARAGATVESSSSVRRPGSEPASTGVRCP